MSSTADDARRMEMGYAAWNDLLHSGDLRQQEDGAYLFPYAGRGYILARPAAYTGTGRPQRWTCTLMGPVADYPFNKGAQTRGRTRQEAVTLMVAEAYGNPCPDGYVTGQDTRPGRDAFAEQFHAG